MRIALAQINPCVGDLAGNVARCVAAIDEARRSSTDFVVLPEMAIPGCPPLDILYDDGFVEASLDATRDLAARVADGPTVVVGTISRAERHPRHHPGLHAAAVVLHGGEVRERISKRLLQSHGAHFEPRWFLPGSVSEPVVVQDRNVRVLVGDDLWNDDQAIHPAAALAASGAEIILAPSASLFNRGVREQRLTQARKKERALVFVNLVGGQDEWIFDGRSFAMNARGELVCELTPFEEEVRIVDLEADGPVQVTPLSAPEELYRALVLGVRDYARKNRLARAVVGVSGGVDSSVVCAIAAEAMGAENVIAVAVPSRHTDPRSVGAARALAQAVGARFEEVSLEALHQTAEGMLGPLLPHGATAENVQARLRMTVLMAFVNRESGFLLNTSNKTELALGYGTLYGDLAGALCVLGDVHKPDVYDLARFINRMREIIPRFTIERPPSAELRPDQVDPFDYHVIAPRIESLLGAHRSDAALRRSEHKRRQAGVILRISETSFGAGRCVPITRR